MKLTRLILILIVALTAQIAGARNLEAKRGVISGGYNFWFYAPDSAKTEAKPVIIFLHGASLCGNDLNRVSRYGTIDAINRGRKIDAYVVAPQNPGGAWNPSKVMQLVDWVDKNGNVDHDRIYVIGMSLGGYGAIDVAAAYPDRIAACMSFCGGGTSAKLADLNKVPLWIVHGTGDRAVNVSESDKVVNAMRKADSETPRLIYDRVPGMNHGQPARFLYLSDSYDWLLSHSLSDEDRPVSEPFDITSAAGKAYKDLNYKSGRSSKKASASSRKKYGKSSARTRAKSKRSGSARAKSKR